MPHSFVSSLIPCQYESQMFSAPAILNLILQAVSISLFFFVSYSKIMVSGVGIEGGNL